MLILGKVRLGLAVPGGIGKGLGYGPAGLEPIAGSRNSKKIHLQLFFQ